VGIGEDFKAYIRKSGLSSSDKFAKERLGANFRVEEIPGTHDKATGYKYRLLENGVVIAQAKYPQSMFGKIDGIAKARGIPCKSMKPTVPAENFCGTLAVNVDNGKLSDKEFREFVKSSLPGVIFRRP